MTITSMAALFGAMMALAIAPDSSTMAVVARSIGSGFSHGFVTVIGILIGDLIFILLAVYGLESIADSNLFIVVKYLGSAYLIGSGILLWRNKLKAIEVEGIQDMSWLSNFMCGLLITLGDPKAIFFYISFLPAFVDLTNISVIDIVLIIVMVTIAICTTKLSYAYMADKSRILFQNVQAQNRVNIFAGTIMIATGVFLAIKA